MHLSSKDVYKARDRVVSHLNDAAREELLNKGRTGGKLVPERLTASGLDTYFSAHRILETDKRAVRSAFNALAESGRGGLVLDLANLKSRLDAVLFVGTAFEPLLQTAKAAAAAVETAQNVRALEGPFAENFERGVSRVLDALYAFGKHGMLPPHTRLQAMLDGDPRPAKFRHALWKVFQILYYKTGTAHMRMPRKTAEAILYKLDSEGRLAKSIAAAGALSPENAAKDWWKQSRFDFAKAKAGDVLHLRGNLFVQITDISGSGSKKLLHGVFLDQITMEPLKERAAWRADNGRVAHGRTKIASWSLGGLGPQHRDNFVKWFPAAWKAGTHRPELKRVLREWVRKDPGAVLEVLRKVKDQELKPILAQAQYQSSR